jgi:hypothetical protein
MKEGVKGVLAAGIKDAIVQRKEGTGP